MIDEALILEAGRRLAEAAGDSAQVILFGSHARGDAGRHSDLDFLVVEPNVENEAEESVRLLRELRDLRIAVDVVVVSQRYADEWREVRGGIVHAAFGEGRVLAA